MLLKVRGVSGGNQWHNFIIDKQELKDKGNKILKDFTQALNRAMVALQNEDFDYLADLLEVEMVEYLDKLSDFNQELLKEN